MTDKTTLYDQITAEFRRTLAGRKPISKEKAKSYLRAALNIARMFHIAIGSREPKEQWISKTHVDVGPGYRRIKAGISINEHANTMSFALQVTVRPAYGERPPLQVTLPVRVKFLTDDLVRLWTPAGKEAHFEIRILDERSVQGPPNENGRRLWEMLTKHMKKAARDLAEKLITIGDIPDV